MNIKGLLDDSHQPGPQSVYMGRLVAGSTGLGPDPAYVKAKEFIRRIKKLKIEGTATKRECKEYIKRELWKICNSDYYFKKSWIEWESLIEAAFGNITAEVVNIKDMNSVVKRAVEIMKGKMNSKLKYKFIQGD